MKKAIATIETEIGIMTIYYNGVGEELTAEKDETVEEIGYAPENEKKAKKVVKDMYSSPIWGLKTIK